MKVFSFRNIRIFSLLLLLAIAAIYTKGQLLHSTSWLNPLPVIIFPINADGLPETTRYIQNLKSEEFSAIDDFMAREGKRYNLLVPQPTHTLLGPEVEEPPPAPPDGASSVLAKVFWSLKLRYWAWQHTPDDESNRSRVRIFILYYQDNGGAPLAHSLGLQKGLLGVVHAYAIKDQSAQNNVVIAHELLHTLGASDKYGLNHQPRYPDGYANPLQRPLHPQKQAEIMAGHIALSETESTMAKSLQSCMVGRSTAWEINWLEDD